MIDKDSAKAIAFDKVVKDFGKGLVDGDEIIFPDEYPTVLENGWEFYFTTKLFDEIDYEPMSCIIIVDHDGNTYYPPPANSIYNIKE